MPARHDSPRRRPSDDALPVAAPADAIPSKTQRKATMHALKDLGVALVELDPKRLAELAADAALPERLVDAIAEARAITAWGARKRQLQYIGKLMRDVEPEPIRRRLDAWSHGRHQDAARLHAVEAWRERLLVQPDALNALLADQPSLDRSRLAALVARARAERADGGPPHAFRELFRVLKDIEPAAGSQPMPTLTP